MEFFDAVDSLLHPVAVWLLDSTPHVASNKALCEREEPSLMEVWTCELRRPLPLKSPVDEYYATWFTSPHQLLLESLVMFVVMVPLMAWGCARIWQRLKSEGAECNSPNAASVGSNSSGESDGGVNNQKRLQQGVDAVERWGWPEKLWGIMLILSVAYQLFVKANAQDDVGQHWAYLFQPCHIHTLILGVVVFSDSLWSRAVMHLSTVLWWGPFLALVAPAAPDDPVQVFMFFFQHWLMMLSIVVRLRGGCAWMYGDFWMNYVPWMWLLFAHYWVIAPVAFASGINIATMAHPPSAIAFFGRCYRLLWTLCCLFLHFMSVSTMKLLAYGFGMWKPMRSGDGSSSSSSSSKKSQ